MEKEDLYRKKANIYTNLAYTLTKVVHSFIMEANANLEHIGKGIAHSEKSKFKNMLNTARLLKGQSRAIARVLYDMEDTDDALQDSDYMADLLLLITDRIGESKEKELKMKNFIMEAFSSECNIYEHISRPDETMDEGRV